ncbi:hypothetical protein K7432_015137 [Basidiobolus ranarum]|uniref:Response regulatory domain-containing protein n=1 Tax=Basidiobolus ranarum TaxID=34480 RepID=A0ABR2WGH9_9FUNG
MEHKEDNQPSEEMDNILHSAKFLSELVNEVLDLANLHENDLVLKERPTSLEELLINVYHLTPLVENEKYRFTAKLEGSSTMRLICDPSALLLIVHRLVHLLSNSHNLDQCEDAKICLKIRVIEEDEDCATIEYLIECSNRTIPSQYLAVGFNPLAQENGSMGGEFGMKGISLTLTRIMILKMGGILISASSPQIGTRFSFQLKFQKARFESSSPIMSNCISEISPMPQAGVKMEAELDSVGTTITSECSLDKKSQQKAKTKGQNSERKRKSKKLSPSKIGTSLNKPSIEYRGKVILAEDNLICQKLAARLLTKNGYTVTTANNGLEAVQAMENSHDYDIALLDIHMPIMDGVEAGRTMREKLCFEGQIIALTANTTSEYHQACVDAGFDAFTSKPIKEEDLLSVLMQSNRK